MNPWIAMLTGAGFGAGAMYMLDPDLGVRRRGLVKDQFERLPNSWQQAAQITARDLKNRTIGFVSEARARLFDEELNDEVLVGRVRSKLGFLVRHPGAIEVQAENGRVILSGAALADETEQLIDGVLAVRGVRELENRVQVHDQPGNAPMLQGDKPKPTGQRLDVWQRHWSPATRFLIGAGSIFLLYCAGRRSAAAAIVPGSLIAGMFAYRLGNGTGMPGSPRRTAHAVPQAQQAGWSS
jgi:hypothetical protein